MSTNFNKNAISSSGGFLPTSSNTPLDMRGRVNTLDDIIDIPNPYVGLLVYVVDVQKRYEITGIKEEKVGLSTVMKVNSYREMPGYSNEEGDTEVVIPTFSVQVETLPPYSDATASITGTSENPILNIGIPRGADGVDGAEGNPGIDGKDGEKGDPGVDGRDGVTPIFRIGEVETLGAGSQATASITGTPENPVLNLGIPKGADSKSAYEIAVENGFDGTEEEWLESLRASGNNDTQVEEVTKSGTVGIYNAKLFEGDTFTITPTTQAFIASRNFLRFDSVGWENSPKPLVEGEELEFGGITFVLNTDGSVTLNGTATTSFYLFSNITKDFRTTIIGQTVKISLFKSDTTELNFLSGLAFNDADYAYNLTQTGTYSGVVTSERLSSLSRVDIRSGVEFNNLTVSAMLELNSDAGYLMEYRKSDCEIISSTKEYQVNDYSVVCVVGDHNISYKLNGNSSDEIEELKKLNVLYGKKVTCLGDSLCYGQGFTGGYCSVLAELEPDTTFINKGIGGARISSNHPDGSDWWIENQVRGVSYDTDYIICQGYVNDYLTGCELGSISEGYDAELDTTTFYGGMESLCKTLVENYTNKRFGFILTHSHYSSSATYVNELYLDAVRECCNKWGVPLLDISNEISPIVPSYRTAFYSDGIHYNEAGYRKIAPSIKEWLKGLTARTSYLGSNHIDTISVVETVNHISYNVLDLSDVTESSKNGITMTVSDEIITLNGTATANAELNLSSNFLEDGTYTFAYEILEGSINGSLMYGYQSSKYVDLSGKLKTMEITSHNRTKVWVKTGSVCNNLKIHLWAVAGEEYKEWQAYGNRTETFLREDIKVNALEDHIEDNESHITSEEREIINRINDGNMIYEDEINKISNKVFEITDNAAIVAVLLADTHVRPDDEESISQYKEMVANISQLTNEIPCDGVIHLGDHVNTQWWWANRDTEDIVYQKYVHDYANMLRRANAPIYCIQGNHDGGYHPEDNEAGITCSEYSNHSIIYRNLGTVTDRGAVRNTNNNIVTPYYYVDNTITKTRMIFMTSNTENPNNDIKGFDYHNLVWLRNTLFDMEKDWSALIFTHISSARFYTHLKNVDTYIEIINAFNEHRVTADLDSHLTADFSDYTGKVVAEICGHYHGDSVIYPDNENARLTCPSVEIDCGSCLVGGGVINSGDFYNENDTNSRSYNDITKHLFDVMVYRPDLNKIYMYRFGAGSDREINI